MLFPAETIGLAIKEAVFFTPEATLDATLLTFATTLLKQGENILTIKELLSHRNLRTTERYLHINGEDLKTAVQKISLS